jgi:hypothetical protein
MLGTFAASRVPPARTAPAAGHPGPDAPVISSPASTAAPGRGSQMAEVTGVVWMAGAESQSTESQSTPGEKVL